MMSTVPSSTEAIRRSSLTCQSVPTPRQSHWNLPSQSREDGVELLGRLVFVLAVGQQDRVQVRSGEL